MPAMIAGGIVGGAVIGGLGSFFGGQSAQSAARENYKHRYQWQVKDMQKAGLNPMLAFQQGAPVPQTPNLPDIGGSAMQGASVGANSAMAIKSQKAMLGAQVQQVQSQTAANNAQAAKTAVEAKILSNQEPFSAQSAEYARDKLGFEVSQLQEQIESLRKSQKLQDIDIEQVKPLAVEYQRIVNQATRLGISEQQATSEFWDSIGKYGKIATFLKMLVGK